MQCRHLSNAVKLTLVLIDVCCRQMSVVNSGVTGRILAIFLCDVERSLLLVRPRRWSDSTIPFKCAIALNKRGYSNVTYSAQKWVMATLLGQLEKNVRLIIYMVIFLPRVENLVKISLVDLEIIWLWAKGCYGNFWLFAAKIGYHIYVPWAIRKWMPD